MIRRFPGSAAFLCVNVYYFSIVREVQDKFSPIIYTFSLSDDDDLTRIKVVSGGQSIKRVSIQWTPSF